jgi:signal transduction histidine kinase
MEIEITRPLALDDRQSRLLDMHSVYNVLTVLLNQVAQIGAASGDLQAVAPIAQTLHGLRDGLADRASTLIQLTRVREIRETVTSALLACEARIPEARMAEWRRRLDNVESIFNIVEVRAIELIERADDPLRWEYFKTSRLAGNLRDVFDAIARNSLGRYRIVYDARDAAPDAYLMTFDFQTADGVGLLMPSVLQDVVRDLASNARKYTAPPDEIRVVLRETPEQIVVEVTDHGRGIPEGEIADMVEFGRRASNVAHREQTGGGFGLTKAYAVTRIFGGRMWVRSAPDAGTRITVSLPRGPTPA